MMMMTLTTTMMMMMMTRRRRRRMMMMRMMMMTITTTMTMMTGSFTPLPHPMESFVTVTAVVDWGGILVRTTATTRPQTAPLTVTSNIDPIMIPIMDLNQPTPATGEWRLSLYAAPSHDRLSTRPWR
jgi:hypothetical protein